MNVIDRTAALTLATIALLCMGATPRPATTLSPAELNREGEQLFGSAWNPALGAWLPSFGDVDQPWRNGQTTHVDQRDGFVYEGKSLVHGYFGQLGPKDGTFLVYGRAGPPRGHVVYDPVHRIAFYEVGCCSAEVVVAAADVLAPPSPVVAKDLSALRTARGARFGQTTTDVMHVYGVARPLPVSGHADMLVLAYTTWPPFKSLDGHNSCGQMQNFVFRHDRLIFIQFGNGC